MSEQESNPGANQGITFRRRNPRTDASFDVTIKTINGGVCGVTTEASAFGATIRLTKKDYDLLKSLKLTEKKTTVDITTDLNDLKGQINSLFEHELEYFASVKLLGGKSWI